MTDKQSLQPHTHVAEIDLDDPIKAGQAIIGAIFPAMFAAGSQMTPEARLLLWASAHAAMSGAMTRELGFDATSVVLEGATALLEKSLATMPAGVRPS